MKYRPLRAFSSALTALTLALLASLWLTGCATTCCQCDATRCNGCPPRPGLVCKGSCGDSCFYCTPGDDCSCDAQCLSPPKQAPDPRSGAPRCETVPRGNL